MIVSSCHCGAVRLELPAKPEILTSCNCSICRRIGALWAYYPPAEVKLMCAPGATNAYVWGDKCLALHTCRTCGCTTHWEPISDEAAGRMGVNARLLDPELIEGLRVKHLDGANTWEVLGWSTHPSYERGASD